VHPSLFHATLTGRSRLVWLAALAAVASSCGAADQGPIAECTAPVSLSVVVTVRDSVSGAAAADGTVGVLSGASVSDTLLRADSLTLVGGDQLGTFSVKIDRPGYLTWTMSGVRVTQRGPCGNVIPAQLDAKLQPVTP
jgi:hypothetical protein